MGKIKDSLITVNVSSGRHNSDSLNIESQRALLIRDIGVDLASIANQLNSIYKPLVSGLADDIGVSTLDTGYSGNIIYTDQNASIGSNQLFWDNALSRKRTVKETVDIIASELTRLENSIDSTQEIVSDVDLSDVESDISEIQLDLAQLAADGFGLNYSLDGDGNPNLLFSLAQIIDAIGANFTGYLSTGLTYPSSYPALSFSVNLSDINIDTTLPQSVINNLSTHLNNIRSFMGMDHPNATTEYDAHGSITYVSNGYSLERAIQTLDESLADLDLQVAYNAGAAGIGGEILLSTLNGEMKIIAPDALGTIQSWYNRTVGDALISDVTKNGIQLYSLPLILAPMGGPPTPSGTNGYVFSKITAGHTELHYQPDTGSDIDVTRNGRVREYEVGSAVYLPRLIQFAAPSNLATLTTASGMIYHQLLFTNANIEYGYIPLAPPTDDLNTRPMKVRIDVYTKPNAGGAGIFQYAIGLEGNRKTGGVGPYEIIEFDEDIDPVWQDAGILLSGNFDGVVAINRQKIFTFNLTLENSPPLGIFPIRVRRDPTDPGDTWTGDVAILKVVATWYRS